MTLGLPRRPPVGEEQRLKDNLRTQANGSAYGQTPNARPVPNTRGQGVRSTPSADPPLEVDPVVIGIGASATGLGDVAIGEAATVTDTEGVAVGDSAIADRHAVALGTVASAAGQSSIAIGDHASAPYNNSAAIGQGVSSTAVGEFVIGGTGNVVIINGALVIADGSGGLHQIVVSTGGALSTVAYP